jgi:hypothetical protein
MSQYSFRISRLIAEGVMVGISRGEKEEVENLIASISAKLPPLSITDDGYTSSGGGNNRSNSNGRGGRTFPSTSSDGGYSSGGGNNPRSNNFSGRGGRGGRGYHQQQPRPQPQQQQPLDPRYNPPADGSSVPPPPPNHINFNVPSDPTPPILNNSVLSTVDNSSSDVSFFEAAKIIPSNKPKSYQFLLTGQEIALGLMVNSSTSSSFSSDGSVSSPDLLSLYGQDPINNNNLQLLSVVVANEVLSR